MKSEEIDNDCPECGKNVAPWDGQQLVFNEKRNRYQRVHSKCFFKANLNAMPRSTTSGHSAEYE